MPRSFSCTWKFQAIVDADDDEAVNGWAEYCRQKIRQIIQSEDHPYKLQILGSAPDELTCQEMPNERWHH